MADFLYGPEQPLTITVGNFTREFVALETTAPKSYDHEGITIEYYASDHFRIVLVDATRVDFQTGRYISGNHGTTVVEGGDSIRRVIEEWLWKRIFGRGDE